MGNRLKKKVFIFDFDGTLVDTLSDVIACFNETLRFFGFPEHRKEFYATVVGGDLETIVSEIIPPNDVNEATVAAVKKKYHEIYSSCRKPQSIPYRGIMELLGELKENHAVLAVNSNKSQLLLDGMVESIFGRDLFDEVFGYLEGRPPKPDAYAVNAILEKYGCTKNQAVYIGDGKSDRQTAQNAGIDFVHVTWGQGTAEAGDFAVCSRAEELQKALFE